MVFARPAEWETWPYHCSLRLFTIVRSSCGPFACQDQILELREIPLSFQTGFTFNCLPVLLPLLLSHQWSMSSAKRSFVTVLPQMLTVPSRSSKASVMILSRNILKRVGESRHPCRTPTVVSCSDQSQMLLLKRTAPCDDSSSDDKKLGSVFWEMGINSFSVLLLKHGNQSVNG